MDYDDEFPLDDFCDMDTDARADREEYEEAKASETKEPGDA